jgi:hypothetical protein
MGKRMGDTIKCGRCGGDVVLRASNPHPCYTCGANLVVDAHKSGSACTNYFNRPTVNMKVKEAIRYFRDVHRAYVDSTKGDELNRGFVSYAKFHWEYRDKYAFIYLAEGVLAYLWAIYLLALSFGFLMAQCLRHVWID